MIKKRNLAPDLVNWIQTQSGLGPGVGDVFFLCPADSSTIQFKKWLMTQGVDETHYGTSLDKLYARMADGRNDVLVVYPGSHAPTAAFTWSKSYTHMIGACSPVITGQRSRIVSSGDAMSPLFTLSGNGCIIKNIMFSNDGAHATTAAICAKVTGARNYFENVTFRHTSATAIVDNSLRELVMNSADGENYFVKCTIGYDSNDAVAGDGICIDFQGTVESSHNTFDQCIMLFYGSADAIFLKMAASATTGWTLFRNCDFINNELGSMDPMTTGFSIAGPNGIINLKNCSFIGVTDLETSDSNLVFTDNVGGAATGGLQIIATW
jgi:hypothetical protein